MTYNGGRLYNNAAFPSIINSTDTIVWNNFLTQSKWDSYIINTSETDFVGFASRVVSGSDNNIPTILYGDNSNLDRGLYFSFVDSVNYGLVYDYMALSTIGVLSLFVTPSVASSPNQFLTRNSSTGDIEYTSGAVVGSGTQEVFTKFTSPTTIGDTQYDVHENPSDNTLSFGVYSNPTTYGQIGHQKTTFGNPGDAQTSQIILTNKIASGSSSDLFANYPTNTAYIIVNPGVRGAMAFTGQIIAIDSHGNTSHFEVKSTFKSVPSPSLVGAYTVISVGEDIVGAVMIKVSIGGTGEVIVNVTNNYGNPIQCVCYARYTETFF